MTLKTSVDTQPAAIEVAQNLLLESHDLSTGQLESVLGNIMQSKVDDADIYFQSTRSEGWSLEEGIVKAGSFSIDQGVGVRAISGEKTAFAYSDDVSLPSLKSASAAVREIGNTGANQSVAAGQPSGVLASADRYLPLDPIASLEAPAKVAMLENLSIWRVRSILALNR